MLNTRIELLTKKISRHVVKRERKILSNDVFLDELSGYFKQITSKIEFDSIYQMDDLYSKAFRYSKTNELEEAKNQYKKAEKIFDQTIASTSIEKYVNIIRLPIIAYIEFKLKNNTKAITLLEHSIKISCELEENEEFYLGRMYVVQQRHNIARVYFAEKKYSEWILSMHTILKYLLNNKISKIQTGLTGNFSNVDKSTHELMINQILHESIKFCDVLKNETYLIKILNNIDYGNQTLNSTERIDVFNTWCSLKLEFANQEISLIDKIDELEKVFLFEDLDRLYKFSLLKSILPYLSNEQFLNLLNSLKTKVSC